MSTRWGQEYKDVYSAALHKTDFNGSMLKLLLVVASPIRFASHTSRELFKKRVKEINEKVMTLLISQMPNTTDLLGYAFDMKYPFTTKHIDLLIDCARDEDLRKLADYPASTLYPHINHIVELYKAQTRPGTDNNCSYWMEHWTALVVDCRKPSSFEEFKDDRLFCRAIVKHAESTPEQVLYVLNKHYVQVNRGCMEPRILNELMPYWLAKGVIIAVKGAK